MAPVSKTAPPNESSTRASARPRKPDWDAIERDFRTGRFTQRELASKHGPSHQAIAKRAKVRGWTQDLAKQIRQATNATLVAELVDKAVATNGAEVAKTVLAVAEVNKQIILSHRARTRRAADITAGLMDELAAQAGMTEHAEALASVLAGESGDKAKARQSVERALSIGSRAATVKALTEALSKQVQIERQAYGLDENESPPEDIPDLSTIAPGQSMSIYLRVVGGNR